MDPGSLWIHFSTDDVAYWADCGPTDSQYHDGHFDKSCWTLLKENKQYTVRENYSMA